MDIDQGQSQMLGEGAIPLNVHSGVSINSLQTAVKDRSQATCSRSLSTLFLTRTANIGQRKRGVFLAVINTSASDHSDCMLDMYPRTSGILPIAVRNDLYTALVTKYICPAPSSSQLGLSAPMQNQQNTIVEWIVSCCAGSLTNRCASALTPLPSPVPPRVARVGIDDEDEDVEDEPSSSVSNTLLTSVGSDVSTFRVAKGLALSMEDRMSPADL